jgi:hypothetical protein
LRQQYTPWPVGGPFQKSPPPPPAHSSP